MKKAIFSLTLFSMAIGAFEASGHSIFKDGKVIYDNVPQEISYIWSERQPHDFLDETVFTPPNKRLTEKIFEIVVSIQKHYRSCVRRAVERAFESPDFPGLFDGQAGYDEQAVLRRCYYPTKIGGPAYTFSDDQEEKWLSVFVHLNLPPLEMLLSPSSGIVSMILRQAAKHESDEREAEALHEQEKIRYIATEIEKLKEAGLY